MDPYVTISIHKPDQRARVGVKFVTEGGVTKVEKVIEGGLAVSAARPVHTSMDSRCLLW